MEKAWAIEIDAVDENDDPQTLRFASRAFTTLPSETPANAFFEDRFTIGSSPIIEQALFERSTTYGPTSVGYGRLELVNTSGDLSLDYLLDWAFDGREVRIYYGVVGAAFPSGWTLSGLAKIERMTLEEDRAVFLLRDRLVDLDAPLCAAKLLGNNTPPNGVEGDSQLKDKRKPRIYGAVSNGEPLMVNASKRIFLVCANQASLGAVYDKGALITTGSSRSSVGVLESTSAAPSTFDYTSSSSGTYFRLGSDPQGTITFDAATTATATASLISLVLTDAGIDPSDVSSSDVTALNSLNSAPVGLYATDEITALDAISQLAESIGAFVRPDRSGVFRMGRLDAPSGSPAAYITTDEIVSCKLVAIGNDDRGLPTWQSELLFDKNYTVQNSDLAGVTDVSLGRKQYLALEYRRATSEDSAIKTRHPYAVALTQQTLLRNRSDAETEAARRLALYGIQRRLFEIVVYLDEQQVNLIEPNVCISVTFPRFGLDAGVLLRVISTAINPVAGKATLCCWG